MNRFMKWLFETWGGGYFCGLVALVLSLIVFNNLWDFKPEPKTFEVVYTQDSKIYQMWDNGTYELLEYVEVNGDSVLVEYGTTKGFVEELKNKNIKKEK